MPGENCLSVRLSCIAIAGARWQTDRERRSLSRELESPCEGAIDGIMSSSGSFTRPPSSPWAYAPPGQKQINTNTKSERMFLILASIINVPPAAVLEAGKR